MGGVHLSQSSKMIAEQGGRTMLFSLAAGETLSLRTERFEGYAYTIHFCVMLLSAE